MNKKLTTSVTAAMLAALTCIATMVIKVPTIGTNGYVNIGDSVVVLSMWILINMSHVLQNYSWEVRHLPDVHRFRNWKFQ